MNWSDIEVTFGMIAVNQAGQVEGRLELDGGYVLTFVMGPDHTCNYGWAPDVPDFTPTRAESPEDDLSEDDA